MSELNHEVALAYRNMLREARAKTDADAENYLALVHVFEDLGARLAGLPQGLRDQTWSPKLGLGQVESHLVKLAKAATDDDVGRLLTLVREARNADVHTGARARHLASNSVRFAVYLEAGLSVSFKIASDFAVSQVVTFEPWRSVASARMMMLEHQFTFLPVFHAGAWQLLSASSLARFIRGGEEKKRLAMELKTAIADGLALTPAGKFRDDIKLDDIIQRMRDEPALLFADAEFTRLTGILTSYDLL